MKCPVCVSTELMMADRQGVEIDYCPQCRGVWLDRGELDKIIERSAPAVQASVQAPVRHEVRHEERSHGGYQHPHRDDHYYKKKKHKSLLGEIFDF